MRVIGTLSNCATIEAIGRELNADDPVNLMGYCHSFSGITLTVVSTETLGSAPLERMLPVAAGPTIGNLSPLAEGDTRQQMLAAAARYLTAIRTRDRDTLAVMHGGGPDGRRAPRDLDRVLAIILDQPDSPFAALRSTDTITTEIFGWKPPLWADDAWRAETARTGTADAIACFSTSRDAAMLWPIDSKDADNIPGRPYACTRIHIGSTGVDAPASFDTEQARNGVEEPIVILPVRDRVIHHP